MDVIGCNKKEKSGMRVSEKKHREKDIQAMIEEFQSCTPHEIVFWGPGETDNATHIKQTAANIKAYFRREFAHKANFQTVIPFIRHEIIEAYEGGMPVMYDNRADLGKSFVLMPVGPDEIFDMFISPNFLPTIFDKGGYLTPQAEEKLFADDFNASVLFPGLDKNDLYGFVVAHELSHCVDSIYLPQARQFDEVDFSQDPDSQRQFTYARYKSEFFADSLATLYMKSRGVDMALPISQMRYFCILERMMTRRDKGDSSPRTSIYLNNHMHAAFRQEDYDVKDVPLKELINIATAFTEKYAHNFDRFEAINKQMRKVAPKFKLSRVGRGDNRYEAGQKMAGAFVRTRLSAQQTGPV